MERTIKRVTFHTLAAPKLKRVAAYARVSSDKDPMGHSLSVQISYFNDLIQKHLDWTLVGIYADKGITGTRADRPEFMRLLADCRAGKIDMQLTAFDPVMAIIRNSDFAEAARKTPYFQKIIPAMRDYFETGHYVFVHGWIPCIRDRNGYSYYSDWRNASADEWAKARWYNGMDATVTCQEEKTIVCGHWHASYGHSKIEGKGSEFKEDADFTPYQASGIIAIDACTAHSGFVNVLVLDD